MDILDKNNRKAPFIVALGIPSILKFDAFFVVIDTVAIPCGNRFLVALDTFLKIPFPLESFDDWNFISHGVARNGTISSVAPVVQAL